MLAGLRARVDQVQCAGHCRHWCQGTSTLRLWGGRSLSQEVRHGSKCPGGPGEGGGPGDGPGGGDPGDGLAGGRTSCLAGDEARGAGDDSQEEGGPCRVQGSRASEI